MRTYIFKKGEDKPELAFFLKKKKKTRIAMAHELSLQKKKKKGGGVKLSINYFNALFEPSSHPIYPYHYCLSFLNYN